MISRHQAREAALQVLYFCDVGGAPPEEALPAFFSEHATEMDEATRAFAGQLVLGTVADKTSLDALIGANSLHWRVERLATMDRLILRLASWELQHVPDTPPAVVIDEALELARTYSTDGSVAFVNGVLDGIRKSMAADLASGANS